MIYPPQLQEASFKSTNLTLETWTSAYAAAQTALTAAEAAVALIPNYLATATNGTDNGPVATFALIRPPGHHATTNLCGGYCYLNNVMICTSHVLRQHVEMKCVIVDVDFHHGNGVEEILYRQRSKTNWTARCQYISLHGHPDYPYYTTHLPTPLAKNVSALDYVEALAGRLQGVQNWCGAETVVLVSLGLDTLHTDPIGGFAGFTSQNDYFDIGKEIGRFVRRIGARTCFILEGGYVIEKLGECVEGVFRGYMYGLEDR